MAEPFRQILGIRFYAGEWPGLRQLVAEGGLIVVPSGPVLADLASDSASREALVGSDIAILDSGFLILLWTVFRREWLPRISGLKFLRTLVADPQFREDGATFWVMPSPEEDAANRRWLGNQGIVPAPENVYVAPRYPAGPLHDDALLARIEGRRPRFVVLNLGGGVQERLGYFLRRRLSYRPAILCTGAAIAFLSRQQANIPPWADRVMIGWFLRSVSQPARFVPRYWKALRLAPLLLRSLRES
jgi:hypothetical protein